MIMISEHPHGASRGLPCPALPHAAPSCKEGTCDIGGPSISTSGLWRKGRTEDSVCISPGRPSAPSGDTFPRSICAFWNIGIHGPDSPSLRISGVFWLPGCFFALREKQTILGSSPLFLSCQEGNTFSSHPMFLILRKHQQLVDRTTNNMCFFSLHGHMPREEGVI